MCYNKDLKNLIVYRKWLMMNQDFPGRPLSEFNVNMMIKFYYHICIKI
jgi:hypothetical protein